MDLRGKKVLVFGTGISGIGAGALLERAQASVILYDGNENLDKENLRKHFSAESSVEILLGSLPLEVMDQLELVVLSPGVPTDLPLVNQLREREIPIWGEVELAYRFASGEVPVSYTHLIKVLKDCFGIAEEDVEELVESSPESRYNILLKGVDYNTAKEFEAIDEDEEKDPNVKGIWLEEDYVRKYPYNSLASDVIGFSNADDVGTDVYKRQTDNFYVPIPRYRYLSMYRLLPGMALYKMCIRDRFKVSGESPEYLASAFLKNFERAGVEVEQERRQQAR